jgi:predicted dehydrogenase
VYGIEKIYTDFDEAIHDSAVDAVYVATPVHLHSFMAVKAIDAGKHILVEKPLGISFDDAQAAVRAESCTDRVCGCAYFRRFYPRYSMLRDMIEAGEFGRLVLVRMSYFSWFNPAVDDPKYWRVIRKKSGGGPIADMGSHMFDVLIGLMGLPATVSAMTSSLDRTRDVEDSSAMVMRMGDDTLVTAGFHWNSKTWVHMFEVVGTEAKVLWEPYDTGPVIKTVGREVTHIDMPNADNVHMPLIKDFVDAVREGRKPLVTFAEAAKTNRLIDAVYRASSEKREVPV